MVEGSSLKQRHILVTGASSGIGRACAVHFAQLGARVAIAARREEALRETLSLMPGEGHLCRAADLSNLDAIEPMIQEITRQGGPLDGFVHSAGVAPMRPLAMTKPAFLNEVMTVNFYAFAELVRVISKKGCFHPGASLIGISSVVSRVGDKGFAAYSASKAAMDGAARSMAKELAEKGIRVNTIVPSYIRTDILEKHSALKGTDDGILGRQYLGYGEARDVAAAAAFLLGDGAKFITGTSLSVDGGYLS